MPESHHARLVRDHQLIDALAHRLSAMIDADTGPAELSLTLAHLADVVRRHLEVEDSRIYDLAMSERPDFTVDKVAAAQAEFEQLKARWGEYLACWTPEEIAADRDAFSAMTRRLLPRLHDRVRLERQLLVAEALTRLPTQAASRAG